MTDTNDENNVIQLDHLGMKRERIVKGMGDLWDTDNPQKITYSNSIMCQTSMPFSNQKNIERWEVRNGNSIMVIRGGGGLRPEERRNETAWFALWRETPLDPS